MHLSYRKETVKKSCNFSSKHLHISDIVLYIKLLRYHYYQYVSRYCSSIIRLTVQLIRYWTWYQIMYCQIRILIASLVLFFFFKSEDFCKIHGCTRHILFNWLVLGFFMTIMRVLSLMNFCNKESSCWPFESIWTHIRYIYKASYLLVYFLSSL